MNSKTLSLFALSILSLVFVMSFASASVSITLVNSSNIFTIDNTNAAITGTANTITLNFQIQENGTGNFTISGISPINFTSATGTSNSFLATPSTNLNFPFMLSNGTSTSFSLTLTIPSDQPLDTYNGILNLTGYYTPSSPQSYSSFVPIKITINFAKDTSSDLQNAVNCNLFGQGQMAVNGIIFTNNGLPILNANTTVGDDTHWVPFENINTEVDIKSKNSSNDLNGVQVDWGIWDSNNQQWVISPSNLKSVDVSGGKTKQLYQQFSIDNNIDADFSTLSTGDHYYFVAIAYGQDSNSNSVCALGTKKASIDTSDFVALTNINMPSTVQCGENVQVTGTLWNTGHSDQSSVSMDIIGSDPSLQLSKNVAVGDISGDLTSKKFSFSFNVPSAISEGSYSMKLDVLDENGNIFSDNTDHPSEYLIPFTVQGGCSLQSQVSVSASILSGGQAGKPMQVKTTITNTGTNQRTYTVQVSGYETWASSASVNQGTITLTPGQSYDVITTFNVNNNASGTESYSLDLASGTQTISQPVSVNIQAQNGFLGINSTNALVWALGILILILIIAIIIIAVRSGRRK